MRLTSAAKAVQSFAFASGAPEGAPFQRSLAAYLRVSAVAALVALLCAGEVVATTCVQGPTHIRRIAGVVVDPQGVPIPGIDVVLRGIDAVEIVKQRTDEDGRFVFEQEKGKFVLRAMAPGFLRAEGEIQVSRYGSGKQLTIRLAPAGDCSSITKSSLASTGNAKEDFVPAPAPDATDWHSVDQLCGQIGELTARGDFMPWIGVELELARTSDKGEPEVVEAATSDRKGHFRFGRLPEGRYRLAVMGRADAPLAITVVPAKHHGVPCTHLRFVAQGGNISLWRMRFDD